MDFRSLTKAVSRSASFAWRRRRPDGLFRRIWVDQPPEPVLGVTQDDAMNVHQTRAGYWSRSRSYMHRIGRFPTDTCQQCPHVQCPAARS